MTPKGYTNRNVKGIEVHVQEKSPCTRKIEDKKDPASGMTENKLHQTGNPLPPLPYLFTFLMVSASTKKLPVK